MAGGAIWYSIRGTSTSQETLSYELGVYHGYYTLHIAEQIGPSGVVVPVEFVPDNYRILALNMKANFPGRAKPINVGADSCIGTKQAFIGAGQVVGFQEKVITEFQGHDYERSEVETDTVILSLATILILLT